MGTGSVLGIGAEHQAGANPLGRHLEVRTARFLLLRGTGLQGNRLVAGLRRHEGGELVEGQPFRLDLLDLRDSDGLQLNRVVLLLGCGVGEAVARVLQRLSLHLRPLRLLLLAGVLLRDLAEVGGDLVLGGLPAQVVLLIGLQEGGTASSLNQQRLFHLLLLRRLLLDEPAGDGCDVDVNAFGVGYDLVDVLPAGGLGDGGLVDVGLDGDAFREVQLFWLALAGSEASLLVVGESERAPALLRVLRGLEVRARGLEVGIGALSELDLADEVCDRAQGLLGESGVALLDVPGGAQVLLVTEQGVPAAHHRLPLDPRVEHLATAPPRRQPAETRGLPPAQAHRVLPPAQAQRVVLLRRLLELLHQRRQRDAGEAAGGQRAVGGDGCFGARPRPEHLREGDWLCAHIQIITNIRGERRGELAYNITMTARPAFHTRNPVAARTPARALRLTTNHSQETEECTFEPRVNHQGSKRTLQRFLQDQDRFQRSRSSKLQRLREEREDEEAAETRSPAIDPSSRRLASRQDSNCSIFERLAARPPAPPPPVLPFSPTILRRSHSLRRNADVSSLLYNDARRRREKSLFLETERALTQTHTPAPHINGNAGRLAARKVLAELGALVSEEEVSPLVAVLALEDLFQVDLNPARQAVLLKSLLSRIVLTHDHVEVVPAARLREFVSVLVGGDEPCQLFTAAEQQAIHQEFRHFYKERLCREKKTATPEKLSFQPQTLSSSNLPAQRYRERACQRVGEFLEGNQVGLSLREGEITIEQLFILEAERRKRENEQKHQENQRRELQQCTFKPDITPVPTPPTHTPHTALATPNKPKITLKPNRKNSHAQPTNPKDKENQPAHCLPPRCNRGSVGGESGLRDMQKMMLRMAAGRQRREFSNTVTERGYPKDQNWTQLQQTMHRRSVENLDRIRRLSFKA